MTQLSGLERARRTWRERNPDASPELTARADQLLETLRTLGAAQWVLDYEEIEWQEHNPSRGPQQ